jgi:hypothetical protein
MPHPKPKGKTSRQKSVDRLRRSKVRKAEREQEAYLQSFFDEDGNLLNIMETDEQLLNNEQIFLTRLFREVKSMDTYSIATFLKAHYNKEETFELIDVYYSTEENKSWSQYIFNLTKKCLGFLNLYDLLSEKVIFDTIKNTPPSGKPALTEEVVRDLVRKCSQDLDITQFNFSELVNNVLLIYSHNKECIAGGQVGGDGFLDWIMYNFLWWILRNVIIPVITLPPRLLWRFLKWAIW